MSINPKTQYGFPSYPRTQDNQTVEQDIKKAALQGTSQGEPDERLKRVVRNAQRRKPEVSVMEIGIEIGSPQKQEEPKENPRKKLDQAIENNAQAGFEYPNGYFCKHLVESLTSKDPGMIALGYDCLKEVVGMLPENARRLIHNSWEEYFDNDSEFHELEDGKASERLKNLYKTGVKPLMMKPPEEKQDG